MKVDTRKNFYVIAMDAGAENPAIPTWASRCSNPSDLDTASDTNVTLRNISEVPGTFQLHNVLSPVEAQRLIHFTESLGFLEDAAVSLPRSIRHNHSLTWIADDVTNDIIWQRCQSAISTAEIPGIRQKPVGLNARFRFYRYQKGDYFSPHTDGSWPGSKIINQELVHNAYHDRWSQMSFLLFLSDNYQGGATQFYVSDVGPLEPARQSSQAKIIDVRTPLGGALCFPHGNHPLHCRHSSEQILSGTKYIIRTDLLFSY